MQRHSTHPSMRLQLCLLWVLSALLTVLPCQAKSSESHRVILRFKDAQSRMGEAELLRKKVQEVATKPGVMGVKALEHLGMAIASCNSLEEEEQLVRELEADPQVELAAPDTWQQFDAAPSKPSREWPLEDLRECSAQSGCAALGLVGQCCPAPDGLMLACCDGQVTQNQVAFKTYFGKYVVAEEDGSMNADRANRSDWETFQLFFNEDGTVSLRSFFGKYVSAEWYGEVNANRDLISDWEKFHLERNEDSTVSLRSYHNRYLVADLGGKLRVNRDKISDWEKFDMQIVGTSTQRFPNDPNFTALWGMNELEDKDIDAPEAWKTFTGEFSAGIVVAVIDTGIDYTHEDLIDNMWINPGEIPDNGVDDDGNGFVDDVHGADFANQDGDPFDDQLHGTHCAGTIAAVGNNGIGVTGVAWRGVRLMALKFLSATGGGKTSDAVSAVNYAVAHGAKISSNSWGGGGSNAALRVAIERAEAAGMLFVAAAGNSGSNNDEDPHYPSNYDVDNIVAVASTAPGGSLSSFSCYGAETVDVAAPGSRILSTAPKGGYRVLSGTSMATPHVTGLAALVWMYRPALSMQQVKEILLSSVEHSEALEGKLLTAGRINARKALAAASKLEPPRPPVHAPVAVALQDTDPRKGILAGTVTITAAEDESDVDYYKVYFVSHAGYQLDSLGSVPATGAAQLTLPLSTPKALPMFAAGLVAISGNATGEMPAQIGGPAPNATVVDLVEPQSGPQAAAWAGDVDLRSGVVAGRLLVTRAEDEATISRYNVYWSDNSGLRGPLAGSIPAIGFMKARCQGSACELINISNTNGGLRFSRENYGNNELATIQTSGPATVKVTRFDTEYHYDTLTIGGHEYSGHPTLPFRETLPEGQFEINWYSDGSVSAGSWSFDLFYQGAVAELEIPAMAPLGSGLEVVAAYGSRELAAGIFVEIKDYSESMPPSPAFTPEIEYAQEDNVSGILVKPAPGAAGSVNYYKLDVVDSGGAILGQGLRIPAEGNRTLFLSYNLSALPAEAEQIVVRAGNDHGLSPGRAVLLVAAIPSAYIKADRHAPSAPPQALRATGMEGSGGKVSILQKPVSTAKLAPPEEPWLQRSAAAATEERRVVWPTDSDRRLSPGDAQTSTQGYSRTQTRVLASLVLPDLDAHSLASPPLRQALAAALRAALPHVGPDEVQLVRISTSRPRPPTASHGAQVQGQAQAKAVIVEFSIQPAVSAPQNAADRIEARLILLSKGGSSAARFHRDLTERLAIEGLQLPRQSRSQISPPQQVAGLSNSQDKGRALSESEEEQPDAWGTDAAASWAMGAGLVGALTAMLVVTRRKSAIARLDTELCPC